jgi:cytidylate kinase
MAKPSDIVLAGPLCAGKSTVAHLLEARGWHEVAAREAIAARAGGRDLARDELAALGARLERESSGAWLAEAAVVVSRPVVVDAARTAAQIRHCRDVLTDGIVVFLSAARSERRRRWSARGATADALADFDALDGSELEREAAGLGPLADLVIDTTAQPVATVVAAVLEA